MPSLHRLRSACASMWLSAALLTNSSAFAADLDDVREQLTREIGTAQRALSAAEAAVSAERRDLAQRINAAQNRVLDLRQRAVASRRMADEETLSLARMESRLEAWEEQSLFQRRLLAGFLDRVGRRSLRDIGEIDLQQDLEMLASYLGEQEARLYPSVRSGSIALPDGQMVAAEVLGFGPVQLFWLESQDRSGLVRNEGSFARASMTFDGSAHAGVRNLFQGSAGVLTFDPTLSRALLLAEDRETLRQHLEKGGFWVVPILLFALFATVTAALKAISLYRLPVLAPALAERAESALKEGEASLKALIEHARGPQAELLAISVAEQSPEQRDERLYAALLDHRNRLERWLGAIAVTAAVSPLLGLLGTVSGMIATFRLMTLFGAGDPSAVSAGISEALVTTELGLVVAIPALLAHALMSRRVKSYLARLEHDAVHLSQLPTRVAGA